MKRSVTIGKLHAIIAEKQVTLVPCADSAKANRKRPNGRKPWERTNKAEAEIITTEQLPLFTMKAAGPNLIKVQVKVNGVNLPMEVDTGAVLSLISQSTRNAVLPRAELLPSSVNL